MVNRVILIGNLGADPEIRTLESGVSVARLRLATSESYKDKNSDEWKENTEWHSITLWRALAERAERTLKKGMQIYVEGKISTRKWTDQEGKERYTTEIIGNMLRIINRRDAEMTQSTATAMSGAPAQTSPQVETNNNPAADMADDLPF